MSNTICVNRACLAATFCPPPLPQPARSWSASGCRSALRPRKSIPPAPIRWAPIRPHWATEPAANEVNAWVVVAPDDTVTIRIAQTELGQGVWTSNAMMVCEELQCDWSKVRPQYASANRDGREMAPEWTLNVMGKGATDPFGRRRARVRRARPERRHRHPEQPLPAHAHQRRGVRAGTAATIFSLPARKRASDCCWRPPTPGACRSKR